MLKRLDSTAFKRIYDKSPIAFAVVTLLRNKKGEVTDFLYEYANQSMADIDNIKSSDIVGKKYSAIYKKYPPKKTLKNLLDVAENKSAGTSQEYWSEVGLSVSMQYSYVGEDTVAISVIGISNIEQMKNQNEQLVNKIPGGVVIIEVTDVIHFYHCNDWYQNILGYTSKEFEALQKKDSNLGLHPEDINILKDSVTECFVNGRNYDTLTLRVLQKNGNYRYLCLNITVVGRTPEKITLYGMYMDVDKHIRLTNKLAYVNAEMDNTIASIPGGISKYVLTENGKLERLYSSPGMAELVGKTQEEYERDFDSDWKENIYYADFPLVQKKIVECIKTLKSTEFTYRLIHKDGSLVWVTALVRVIGEKDGRPLAHAVFHAMTKSEILYQTLLDNIDTITIVRDINANEILYANKAAAEYFNIDEKLIIGKNFVEVMDENNIPYEEIEAGVSDNEHKEILIGEKCFNITIENLVWNDRQSRAVFLTDITESYLARQELQGDRDMLEDLISKIPLGLVVFKVDEEGKILVELCNDTICDIIKISKSEITYGEYKNLNLPFVFHPDDIPVILNSFNTAKVQTTPFFFSFRIIGPNEEITWFTANFQGVPNGDGTYNVYAGFIDITAQKIAEEQLVHNAKELRESIVKLQENEERFNAVSRRAELFHWEIDLETGEATATFAAEDSPSRNYHNKDFGSDFVIKQDLEYFVAMTNIAATGKEQQLTFDIRVSFVEDEHEWYRVTYDAIKDDEGKVVSLLGLAQNINELKLLQRRFNEEIENLENANQRQDVLATMRINLTDDCVESYSSKPQIQLDIKVDDKYSDSVNIMAAPAITNHQMNEFKKFHDRERLLKCFENGESALSLEFQSETHDKEILWLNNSLRLYRHPTTKKVMCFIYCYDVNDIHNTKDIVNKVVEAGYEHISIINTKNRKIEFAIDSKNARTYLKPGEVYDRALMQVFSDLVSLEVADSIFDSCCLSNVLMELEDRDEFTFPFSVENNAKKERKLLTYSWFDDEKTKILLHTTDITEVYQQEIKRSEELSKALESAVLANKSKTDFLSRMSHEIRTPMNAILGMSRLGEDVAKDESVVSYFRDINNSGNYLLGLINDILDMSRIEEGKMEINNKFEDREELIRSVEVVVRPLAERKDIEFVIESEGESPSSLYLDKLRAQQVYINILNNAVKFTEPGGKVTWKLSSEIIDDKHVRYRNSIIDTGCGMSQEFLNHIFEPFAQEKNSLVDARQGTGLGLAIAKSIVEKMGGKIFVESEIGKGTVFTLEFVREYKNDSVSENIGLTHEADDVKNVLEGKKVLLCEDHPLNTVVATKLLEKVGMIVETAENGLMGVNKFSESQESEFDVVLMDIRMPVMDGLEATAKIRALNRQDAKSIPIIAMTANAFAEDRELSKKVGMNEHLSKPIEPKILYKTLTDYIK